MTRIIFGTLEDVKNLTTKKKYGNNNIQNKKKKKNLLTFS